ncbi:hypothetical protein PFISCL1PPCAC_17191, partial [Pristionchus fissidentatus]
LSRQDSMAAVPAEFKWHFPNIASLTPASAHSAIRYLHGLPWLISIETEVLNDVKYLAIYSFCCVESTAQEWSVDAEYELLLHAHAPNAASINSKV